MADLGVGQLHILNSLVDDVMEPLEQAFFAYREVRPEGGPAAFLEDVMALFRLGLITIEQEGMPGFGQKIEYRKIAPTSPAEILGDLADDFVEFCRKGDYLWRVNLTGEVIDRAPGVPFGIYVAITEAGRSEWNRLEHQGYLEAYFNEEADG